MHMQPYVKPKYYTFNLVESLQKTRETEAEYWFWTTIFKSKLGRKSFKLLGETNL